MTIRLAQEKDIPKIIDLLQQVLEVHAKIRPDIFISGTTKYSFEDVKEMLGVETKPIYVAVDEEDNVLGYAICEIKETPEDATNKVKFKQLYIDDLCVDEKARGQHVGKALFEYVKEEAKQMGCYEVTLAVWTGNDRAEAFYEGLGMKTKERIMEFIL
ncbi:GNAT family N-acetyltransferase [Pseudobutyrivibrio xylanivorans]|uniref:Ribosomal protein S18 acetylase RimI n=1 Tax=Pseudobutyrivibrio xylanivorans DSM 14809 TaxID=1123012 RepID=A0A1M6IYS9_PSEXY|nr:GNAT family N-acetyltransferase [Pseudobutyrivibrio xylanivorans]SHJ39621.1 Ribosomal protein S18 acetylase RimI [Pseudobutyrivibrio xylanivorans DSM 14809]